MTYISTMWAFSAHFSLLSWHPQQQNSKVCVWERERAEIRDMFGGIYDDEWGVGFMKLEAHLEQWIGWTLFIVQICFCNNFLSFLFFSSFIHKRNHEDIDTLSYLWVLVFKMADTQKRCTFLMLLTTSSHACYLINYYITIKKIVILYYN